jgi:hypothetical protein
MYINKNKRMGNGTNLIRFKLVGSPVFGLKPPPPQTPIVKYRVKPYGTSLVFSSIKLNRTHTGLNRMVLF